jgi:5-formyltetrahydrofolate cyclo-ligase
MTKSALRKEYKVKRKLLSPRTLDDASQAITERVLSNFQLEGKTVSLFLPIERHFEINTYGLMERAFSYGAHIGLPVADFHLNTLIHRVYNEETILHLNEFDIPEPTNGKKINSELFDYVFVPLLAVDKKGYRVGYGKGFYDRFLKSCKPSCKFIGLHLFDLVEGIEDIEKTDIPLHAVVTPEKIIHF